MTLNVNIKIETSSMIIIFFDGTRELDRVSIEVLHTLSTPATKYLVASAQTRLEQ